MGEESRILKQVRLRNVGRVARSDC